MLSDAYLLKCTMVKQRPVDVNYCVKYPMKSLSSDQAVPSQVGLHNIALYDSVLRSVQLKENATSNPRRELHLQLNFRDGSLPALGITTAEGLTSASCSLHTSLK